MMVFTLSFIKDGIHVMIDCNYLLLRNDGIHVMYNNNYCNYLLLRNDGIHVM